MIRIGIVGYGNIGRGVEIAVNAAPDMELVGVFTRRPPKEVSIATPAAGVYHIDDAFGMADKIDVMILCGGSATDLPEQGPLFASKFCTVDSFDTHAKIPGYFASVDAQAVNKTSIISVGWDPGLFSIIRMLSGAVLPVGEDYTFWGKGVSQGHSDAIRRVKGVKNGIQYTVPIDSAIDAVRSGANPALSTREKHLRDCYVVLEEGADASAVENAIVSMPNYFADYETKVTFITEEELKRDHSAMPHGGFVFRSGETGSGNKHIIEFGIKLDSNPEFTSSVLVAYARAAHRLCAEGSFGAKTVFDVPLSYLSDKSGEELRKILL